MLSFQRPNVSRLKAEHDVKRLIKALGYRPKSAALQDAQVRSDAADALGALNDPQAIGPLCGALQDFSEQVGIAAARSLGTLKDAQAVRPLIAALDHHINYNSVSIAIIEALAQIGDVRAAEALRGRLKAQDLGVCKAAAEALVALKDVDAVPALVEMAGRFGAFAEVAERALTALGWEPGQDAVGAAYWIGMKDWGKCVGIGAAAVGPLLAVLDRWGIGEAAAEALGEIGDVRAIEPLVNALANPNSQKSELAAAATRALSNMKHPASVEPLITALKQRQGPWDSSLDKHVRYRAATVLGEICDPRAVVPLCWTLHDDYQFVREAAGEALEKYPAEMIVGALADPAACGADRQAVASALDYLGWQRDDTQTEPPIGWRKVRGRRKEEQWISKYAAKPAATAG